MTATVAQGGLGISGSNFLNSWKGTKPVPTLILLAVAAVFWQISPPEGLEVNAWHLLIIFLTTIAAVIAKPLPIGAIAVVACSSCIVTGVLTVDQVLSSFGKGVVWLIVLAFFLALGFKTTGLGKRLAFFCVAKLGKSSLGLSYGFVLTELLLAPFIPSNTARGAGVIFPVLTALSEEQGSTPEKGTEGKLGRYLVKVAFQTNLITSAIFLTAMVANPLISSFSIAEGVQLDWTTWAVAAIVPGVANLVLLPLIMMRLDPPEIKSSPNAQSVALKKLKEMGKLSQQESLMLVIFLGVLTLWMVGDSIGIDPTAAALIGFACLLVTGVLKWEDCISENQAWETFMWFAPLLMMATNLTNMGMMTWFAQNVGNSIPEVSWPVVLLLISAFYIYSSYLFASITAKVTAFFSAFLIVLISVGTPPMIAAMTLAVLSSLGGSLTNFSTGSAPVYFGAGYVSMTDWWRTGFIMSICNMAIWAVVGGLWWKALGYW